MEAVRRKSRNFFPKPRHFISSQYHINNSNIHVCNSTIIFQNIANSTLSSFCLHTILAGGIECKNKEHSILYIPCIHLQIENWTWQQHFNLHNIKLLSSVDSSVFIIVLYVKAPLLLISCWVHALNIFIYCCDAYGSHKTVLFLLLVNFLPFEIYFKETYDDV